MADGVQYLFTSEGMREVLKGFDFNRALKELHQAGLLVYGADGKSSRPDRIHGRKVRVYIVNPNGVARDL